MEKTPLVKGNLRISILTKPPSDPLSSRVLPTRTPNAAMREETKAVMHGVSFFSKHLLEGFYWKRQQEENANEMLIVTLNSH